MYPLPCERKRTQARVVLQSLHERGGRKRSGVYKPVGANPRTLKCNHRAPTKPFQRATYRVIGGGEVPLVRLSCPRALLPRRPRRHRPRPVVVPAGGLRRQRLTSLGGRRCRRRRRNSQPLGRVVGAHRGGAGEGLCGQWRRRRRGRRAPGQLPAREVAPRRRREVPPVGRGRRRCRRRRGPRRGDLKAHWLAQSPTRDSSCASKFSEQCCASLEGNRT